MINPAVDTNFSSTSVCYNWRFKESIGQENVYRVTLEEGAKPVPNENQMLLQVVESPLTLYDKWFRIGLKPDCFWTRESEDERAGSSGSTRPSWKTELRDFWNRRILGRSSASVTAVNGNETSANLGWGPGIACLARVIQFGANLDQNKALVGIGELVLALCDHSAQATFICAYPSQVLPVPGSRTSYISEDSTMWSGLSLLAVNYLSAFQMLKRHSNITNLDYTRKILIVQGETGIGSAVMDLAMNHFAMKTFIAVDTNSYGSTSTLVSDCLNKAEKVYYNNPIIPEDRNLQESRINQLMLDFPGGLDIIVSIMPMERSNKSYYKELKGLARMLKPDGSLIIFGSRKGLSHGTYPSIKIPGSDSSIPIPPAPNMNSFVSFWLFQEITNVKRHWSNGQHLYLYDYLYERRKHLDWFRDDLKELLQLYPSLLMAKCMVPYQSAADYFNGSGKDSMSAGSCVVIDYR